MNAGAVQRASRDDFGALIDVFIRQEAEHSRQHVLTHRKIEMDKIATLWKGRIAEELEHSYIGREVLNPLDDSRRTKALGKSRSQFLNFIWAMLPLSEIAWKDAEAQGTPFWPPMRMILNGDRSFEATVLPKAVENDFRPGFDPEIHAPWTTA